MKLSNQLTRLLLAFIVASCFISNASAQCYVIKDSIITGNGTGRFADYVYAGTVLGDIYYTDSAQFSPSNSVKAYYNSGSGLLERLEFFYTVGTVVKYRVIEYTISGGRVTEVFDSTDSQTTTYSISYDGSGNISSVILTAFTGNPDFPASFTDFVWQNGNIISLNLVVGSDTIELSVSTDTKNNVKKKMLPTDGASDIFQTATANNITNVIFVNDENIGGMSIPAGSYAIRQVYTYTASNDVDTRESLPSAFDDKASTTKFFYDCTLSISPVQAAPIAVLPNPATDIITLDGRNFNGVVKIFNVTGKLVRTEKVNNLSSLNISDLISGIYYIEITDGKDSFRGKVLKN